jgi:hypothetical protein
MRLTFQIMSVPRMNDLRSGSIPTIDKRDFVAKCYQVCACEIGNIYPSFTHRKGCKSPHLFDKSIDPEERLKNYKTMQLMIISQINDVIISFLPIHLISAPKDKKSKRHKKIKSPTYDTYYTQKHEVSPERLRTPKIHYASPPKNAQYNTVQHNPVNDKPSQIKASVNDARFINDRRATYDESLLKNQPRSQSFPKPAQRQSAPRVVAP